MSTNQIPIQSEIPSDPRPLGNLGFPISPDAPGVSTKEADHSQPVQESPHEFATFVHEYTRELIQFADQKAAALLTLSGAMLGILDSKKYVLPISDAFSVHWLVGLIQVTTCISLCVSVTSSLLTVLPRVGKSPDGVIYFKSVAAHKSRQAYSISVTSKRADELVLEVLHHNHSLAKICSQKYLFLTIASYSGAVGLALGLLLLITRG